MAEIQSYTVDTVINDADKVIGSDSANSDVTRNFRMDDISDYVRGNIVLSDITDVTATELNILDGATITTAELNILDGVNVSATELNLLDGAIVTTTELNYLDGVTSDIQTQLNGKQSTITGGATTIVSTNLTASRALVSNSDGKVAVSDITSTELGYLDGVTSNVQTQIDGIDQFEPENTGNANQVLTKTATGYAYMDAQDVSYTLTTATSSQLGGVIVPDSSDIEVDSTGNLTLGNISTNKITSGTLPQTRYADVTASKIDGESSMDGYVLTSDGSGGVDWEAVPSGGHTIQANNSDQITRTNLSFQSPLTVTDNGTDDATEVGLTLAQSDLPNLSAAKITSGVFSEGRLSTDTPTDQQVLTYQASSDSMVWSNKGSFTLVFGDEHGEVAPFAQGDNASSSDPTHTIPSALIDNVDGAAITTGNIALDRLAQESATEGQVLTWNNTTAQYEPQNTAASISPADNNTLGGVIVEDSSDIAVDAEGKLTLKNIDASKIGSGSFPNNRIDALPAGKITSGVFDVARLSTDTPEDGEVPTYDAANDVLIWGEGGGGGHTIQSEGTDQTQREKLNFTGDVTITDDSDNDATVVDIDVVQALVDATSISEANQETISENIGVNLPPIPVATEGSDMSYVMRVFDSGTNTFVRQVSSITVNSAGGAAGITLTITHPEDSDDNETLNIQFVLNSTDNAKAIAINNAINDNATFVSSTVSDNVVTVTWDVDGVITGTGLTITYPGGGAGVDANVVTASSETEVLETSREWTGLSSSGVTDAEIVAGMVNSDSISSSDQSAIRDNIGAGTSNLALGTTSTTALAGDTNIPNIPSHPPATDGSDTQYVLRVYDSNTDPINVTTTTAWIQYTDENTQLSDNEVVEALVRSTGISASQQTSLQANFGLGTLADKNIIEASDISSTTLSTSSETSDDSDTTLPTTAWVKAQNYGTSTATDNTVDSNLSDVITLDSQELNAVDANAGGDDTDDHVIGWDDSASKITYLSPADVRTAIGVDASGTDNSTDVTIATTASDVLTVSGQELQGVDAGSSDMFVVWDNDPGKLTYFSPSNSRVALGLGDLATLDQISTSHINGSALATDSELTSDNNTTIPTTAWVKDQGYLESNTDITIDNSTPSITLDDSTTYSSNSNVGIGNIVFNGEMTDGTTVSYARIQAKAQGTTAGDGGLLIELSEDGTAHVDYAVFDGVNERIDFKKDLRFDGLSGLAAGKILGINASGDVSVTDKATLSDLSITATATELNLLDGVTATTTELNYVDGVTSAIQTQLDNLPVVAYATGTAYTSGQRITDSNKLYSVDADITSSDNTAFSDLTTTELLDGTAGSGGGNQFSDQQALEDFITNKADFRSDIGAGTSNLVLGTTSTTALAGNTSIPDLPNGPDATEGSDKEYVLRVQDTDSDNNVVETTHTWVEKTFLQLGTTATTALAGNTVVDNWDGDITGDVTITNSADNDALNILGVSAEPIAKINLQGLGPSSDDLSQIDSLYNASSIRGRLWCDRNGGNYVYRVGVGTAASSGNDLIIEDSGAGIRVGGLTNNLLSNAGIGKLNNIPALPTGSSDDDSTANYVLQLTDGSTDTYAWVAESSGGGGSNNTLNANITDVLSLSGQEINSVDAGDSDAVVGWDNSASKLTYLSAADARAAIGAGTSSLTIGTTATTALAGNTTTITSSQGTKLDSIPTLPTGSSDDDSTSNYVLQLTDGETDSYAWVAESAGGTFDSTASYDFSGDNDFNYTGSAQSGSSNFYTADAGDIAVRGATSSDNPILDFIGTSSILAGLRGFRSTTANDRGSLVLHRHSSGDSYWNFDVWDGQNTTPLTIGATDGGDAEVDIKVPLVLSGTTGGNNQYLAVDASGNVTASTVSSDWDGGEVTNDIDIKTGSTHKLDLISTYGTKSSSSIDNTGIGHIRSKWFDNDLSTESDYTTIGTYANNFTDGSEWGSIWLSVRENGASTLTSYITANSGDSGRVDIKKPLYAQSGLRVGGTGTANNLDDYEEGSWTPVWSTSIGKTIAKITSATEYVKVGRMVLVTFRGTSSGTANGLAVSFTRASLPFAPATNHFLTGTFYNGNDSGVVYNLGATSVFFRGFDGPAVVDTDLLSAFAFTITYYTDE